MPFPREIKSLDRGLLLIIERARKCKQGELSPLIGGGGGARGSSVWLGANVRRAYAMTFASRLECLTDGL